MPARSTTLKTICFCAAAALRVAPAQAMAVPLTLSVMSVQVVPPSTEPYSMSVLERAALRLALMVCAAVLVMKSVLAAPLGAVSALSRTAETVCVGAAVSSV